MIPMLVVSVLTLLQFKNITAGVLLNDVIIELLSYIRTTFFLDGQTRRGKSCSQPANFPVSWPSKNPCITDVRRLRVEASTPRNSLKQTPLFRFM